MDDRKKINDLAQKIKELSDNFHTIQHQRFSTQGDFAKREDDLRAFERAVQDKRQRNADRKETLQQRRRRIQQEIDEIKHCETQLKLDFQKEKNEITDEIDRKELEHLKEVKLVKEKTIEQEVEQRRLLAESEKLNAQTAAEENSHSTKLEELQLEINQLQEQRVRFSKDSA